MVGIVVVSHSAQLAEAALALTREMVAGAPPRVVLAAGTSDGGFGTDAVRVADAIAEADDGQGVVVLTDLGSAVLSAEMALEFLSDPDVEVRVVPAPFVEGLLAAVVRAAGGASLAEVAAEAAGALAGKIEQLGGQPGDEGGADTGAGSAPGEHAAASSARSGASAAASVEANAAAREVQIVNPAGLHARPAGQLAAAAAGFDATVTVTTAAGRSAVAVSALGLAGLGTRAGDTVTLTGEGPEAQAAVAALSALIAEGFGEAAAGRGAGAPGEAPRSATRTAASAAPGAQPIGVSPGRVFGPVLRMPDALPEPDGSARLPEGERDAAVAALERAVAAVSAGYRARADAAETPAPASRGGALASSGSAPASAEVLRATAALASDPSLIADATAAIRERGLTPEAAAWETLETVAAQFAEVGGLQAERVTDLRDIRTRVVAELTGAPLPGIPESAEPFVLVADDLAPADTAELDPARCIAILSAEGGPTSHTAILARGLGIPAVVAAPIARELVDGDIVLVDGTTGEVMRDPDATQRASATSEPAVALEPFAGPGATADGTAVGILANVGGPADVAAAVERGADGVGLFRTEFCFLGRTEAPGFDEQVAAYRSVLEGFRGGHVVLRTLDAGSDKPLPFLTPEHEQNPALGVRGFRTARLHPDVLTLQLEAIAAAAGQVPDTAAWVMAPMIATVTEAADFASQARAAGLDTVGVMVETPAAALMSAELFAHVDFVSLGTNDLAQYTMAADRLSGPLAELGDPWQPAVLRLIAECATGAAGRPVGVCGEAAADPLLARVLVGLGVTSLSMTARAVPAVGAAIGETSLAQCRSAATAAVAATTAREARAAAAAVIAVEPRG
ncbi:hypothetical protein GCM10020360_29670 [Nonlabens tegetincola]